MKNQKYKFLFMKIYLPIFLITVISMLIIYLLTTPISSIVHYVEIPGIKDSNGLLQEIERSRLFRIMGFIIIVVLLLKMYRKKYSEVLFNNGNVYLDISYFHLILAAKVLGYKKISLVRVPIALQYKIVIKDTFENIDSDVHDKRVEDVVAEILNEDYESDEVNLVLSDTYKVEIEQLPDKKTCLTMVWIDSEVDKPGNRIYNPKFVKEIQSQTHNLSNEYKRINIFSHTNTHHNKEIIESCFKKGGRSEFQAVYVYQYFPQFSKFYEIGEKVK